MSSFARNIRPYVDAEFARAREARGAGDFTTEFRHLERAHVLGQASTRQHARAHWRMLLWGVRRRDGREVFGQIVRLVGALTKTFIGLVPTGNTGGANVSPVQPFPIPPDLAAILERAAGETRRGDPG